MLVELHSRAEVANATGLYYVKREPTTPSAEARDDAAAARLWAESERIATSLS